MLKLPRMQITKSHVALALIAAFVTCFFIINYQAHNVVGSTTPGSQAVFSTSTATAVSTSASTLFATSSCAARIITTYASPVMLTFSDKQGATPTGALGHLQAASTTVVYDSGLFGCDRVQAYSFAAQTITITETH